MSLKKVNTINQAVRISLNKKKSIVLAASLALIFVIFLIIITAIWARENSKRNESLQKDEPEKSKASDLVKKLSDEQLNFIKCFEKDDLEKFKEIYKKNNLKDIKSLEDLRIEGLPLLNSLESHGSSKIMEYVLKKGIEK